MSASGSIFRLVFSSAAAALGCFAATPAIAQCSQVPDGRGGTQLYCGPSVMPQPGAPRQAPSQAGHYAAIYYDETTGDFGTSWRAGSEAEAKQIALQNCRSRGGRNCQFATSGPLVCVALATGTDGAWGPA